MHCEDIQRIVNADEKFELSGVVAGSSANDAIDNSGPGWDVTGPWRDRDQACNNPGAEADSGPFLLESVVKNTPGDASDGSCEIGNDGSHDRA